MGLKYDATVKLDSEKFSAWFNLHFLISKHKLHRHQALVIFLLGDLNIT